RIELNRCRSLCRSEGRIKPLRDRHIFILMYFELPGEPPKANPLRTTKPLGGIPQTCISHLSHPQKLPCPIHSPFFWRKGGTPRTSTRAPSTQSPQLFNPSAWL